jgi:hypothetical protein
MHTQPAKPEPEFTRRSKTESICMRCFATVRAKRPEFLDREERLHAATCKQRRYSEDGSNPFSLR